MKNWVLLGFLIAMTCSIFKDASALNNTIKESKELNYIVIGGKLFNN